MLRACIEVIAVPEDIPNLRKSSVKIRVSMDTTCEQIAVQIRDTFGLCQGTIYELTNDEELCSLPAVSASLCRWIKAGDANAPTEYDSTIESNKATVPLHLRLTTPTLLSNTSEQTAPTLVSPASTTSSKKMREHKAWKQDALQVSKGNIPTNTAPTYPHACTQVCRDLHPRLEAGELAGMYVLAVHILKQKLAEKAAEMLERIEDLVIHKVQLKHQVQKREIATYLKW
jgi:hypothetical protein